MKNILISLSFAIAGAAGGTIYGLATVKTAAPNQKELQRGFNAGLEYAVVQFAKGRLLELPEAPIHGDINNCILVRVDPDPPVFFAGNVTSSTFVDKPLDGSVLIPGSYHKLRVLMDEKVP